MRRRSGTGVAGRLGACALAFFATACAGKKPENTPAGASGAESTARATAEAPRPVLEPGIPGWDEDTLSNAAYALVPRRQLEISKISSLFRWHPADGQEVLVWAVCQGMGDSRGCTVLAGRPWDDHRLRVLAYQPCGWSEPTIAETPDRAQLLITGDDGRGSWRQMLGFDAGDSSLAFSRRVYMDGL